MKMAAFYLGVGLCFSLGCSDETSSSDSRPTSSGSLSEIVDLCSKVESVMKGNAPGTEACESKLSGLKERNDRLFLEVGKCIKNASKSAELKTCNDRYNPRYRKVATERRAAAGSPQVAIKTGQVSETDSEHLMTRFNALSDKLKDPFCPGKTMSTCTSPESLNLQARLKQMMIDGMTDREIMIRLRDEGCTFDPRPCSTP